MYASNCNFVGKPSGVQIYFNFTNKKNKENNEKNKSIR